ncbi:MAG: dTDP-4-amino-4,6-dideoxygalactose transaminase [Prevotella sp.]
MKIPFNKTYLTGDEETYIHEALLSGQVCGNHTFCKKVLALMKTKYGYDSAFLVPSGTAALEMGVVLANLQPGDEVIVPSYTFSSTVNAIVLFGGFPVFCDIDLKTMNIDYTKIEALITHKTKMIMPIDYAGVPCDIDEIMEIANRHHLIVLQDCAQSYGSYYKGIPSGKKAHIAAFSFHETKNYSAGEGGLLINNVPEWHQRATFLQEKGTDRSLVINGQKNKYSWVDKGSSYLLSDLLAAVLYAQLSHEDEIKSMRAKITEAYINLFKPYWEKGLIQIFEPKDYIQLNHHAFWAIFPTIEERLIFMNKLKEKEIYVYIGYMPLHSAPYGQKLGYKPEDVPLTEDFGNRIARLPFYTSLAGEGLEYTIENMKNVLIEMYGF